MCQNWHSIPVTPQKLHRRRVRCDAPTHFFTRSPRRKIHKSFFSAIALSHSNSLAEGWEITGSAPPPRKIHIFYLPDKSSVLHVDVFRPIPLSTYTEHRQSGEKMRLQLNSANSAICLTHEITQELETLPVIGLPPAKCSQHIECAPTKVKHWFCSQPHW